MVDTFRPLALGEGGTASDDGKYAWSWSGRGPSRVTWLDLPRRHRLRARQPAATGSSPRPDAGPRTGVADRRPRARPLRRAAGDDGTTRPGRSTRSWPAGPRPGRRCARGLRSELTDDAAPRPRVEPLLVPVGDVTHAPADRGRRLRRLLQLAAPRGERRPDLPPGRRPADPELDAPADRLPRPGRHGAGLGHPGGPPVRAAQGSPRTTSRRSARRGGWTSRPRSASSSGRRRRWASRCRWRAFAEHVFGVCLVNDWSARDLQAWEYVPLGPVPRQVVPDLGLAVGGPAGRAGGGPGGAAGPRHRSCCPTSTTPRTRGARHRPGGAAEREAGQPAAVPRDVLDAGPAARPPDGQRGRAAHRRPVRVGHGQRPGARPARLPARAAPGTAPSR